MLMRSPPTLPYTFTLPLKLFTTRVDPSVTTNVSFLRTSGQDCCPGGAPQAANIDAIAANKIQTLINRNAAPSLIPNQDRGGHIRPLAAV